MSIAERATADEGRRTSIQIKNLRLANEAPANANLVVRKSDDAVGMAELEASIKHMGVVYPLIVTMIKDQNFVIAGNRRLKCLRKLHGVDSTLEVPVVFTDEYTGDDVQPAEVAMAVNISLPPHDVDRFEIFSAQIKAGLSPDDLASRTALSLKQISQVLALAELAPEIREAWRNGLISKSAAEAFTLAPSHEEQLKFYKKSGPKVSDFAIKHRFGTPQDVGLTLEFVGIENYEKTGGKVRRDLFGTSHHVDNLKMLTRLYEERIDAECARLIADGWAFAESTKAIGSARYSYGSITPSKITTTKAEKEKLAALDKRMEESGESGDIDAENEKEELEAAIQLRAFTKENKARSGCFVGMSYTGELEIEYGRTKPAEASKAPKPKAGKVAEGKPAKPEASGVLKQRLESQLLTATAAAIVTATQGAKGLGPLLGRLVASQIVPERAYSTPDVVRNGIEAIRRNIDPKVMQAAIAQAFDAKDYFASISKAMIVAVVQEAMGADHARKVGEMTKDDAAKFAVSNVIKTGWLPKELRVAGYAAKKAPKK